MNVRETIPSQAGNGLVWISAGLHFLLLRSPGVPASLLGTLGVAVPGKPGMDYPATQLS